MLDVDEAYERFREIAESIDFELSETDTRVKIIDEIFKNCLGWEENDITREEHVHKGYIDYIFKYNDIPMFVLEAKKIGTDFRIPTSLGKRKYKISGTIVTDIPIKKAIEQVARYSQESGITYSIITNGMQFLIFASFKRGVKWREGFCTLFHSLKDILENFTYFLNILSKESVGRNSLRIYISEEVEPLRFERPLDEIHYEEASAGKNFLAPCITPLINSVFLDLTDDSRVRVLENCYIKQTGNQGYDRILELSFDKLPYYPENHEISSFMETETSAGEFQASFDKRLSFLREETPRESFMILLGGIGSGKTTFIHHFFKVTMRNRDDIVWFYVNFGASPPNPKRIEEYIYEKIVEKYELHYSPLFREKEKAFGADNLRPTRRSILRLFTMMKYFGKNVALVLDNADQHSHVSPEYQERVFEYAQNIAAELRTITILNLREESYFRATQSGVLDAYPILKYHISSPDFGSLIRKRIKYVLDLLEENAQETNEIRSSHLKNSDTEYLKLFFRCLYYSLREERRQGKEILRFINDISGGNMRQALTYFNIYMTSGNTDIDEMYAIERRANEDSYPDIHYQIPLHHIVKSIVIGDHRYYGSERSFIMNLFQINPEYTTSHFIHLKILEYLNKRRNYSIRREKGFVGINDILIEAELGGESQLAISDSLRRMATNGLVEFENQDKNGYDRASFVKITQMGRYYLEKLVSNFTYLDLVFGDTPICDKKTVRELRMSLVNDDSGNKLERISKRFERTEIFISYLKEREEKDFENNVLMTGSNLTNQKFMDRIRDEYEPQKTYILRSIQKVA